MNSLGEEPKEVESGAIAGDIQPNSVGIAGGGLLQPPPPSSCLTLIFE